ncbi:MULTISPECIES: GAF domain-containing protein [unclassified Pseudactinotalea]|uniref:sensor histidine kinase n=1 Tax=unclassified Pseudactinotalea TaxID=2649176 RepID=UPI003C7A8F02
MEPILRAVLSLTSHLELDQVLQELVDTAAQITGARYAAIGVLDSAGVNETFIYTGMPRSFTDTHDPPRGHGVLGAIPAEGALILDDLTTHEAFGGFPADHPPMRSFLGLPLLIGGQVYGRIYLSEKPGGFSQGDADQVKVLAAGAAIAVQNARLYSDIRTRERWVAAGQEITTAMLQGIDVEEALEMIAQRARTIARADTAVLVLPGLSKDWVIEIVDGDLHGDLLGATMPANGRAVQVIESGSGMIVDSFARAEVVRLAQFSRYGPSLYAPLTGGQAVMGVIVLLRRKSAPEFTDTDLAIAESFARQAALTLELAEARDAQDRASVLDERARISRDLHDLAIQQLFASGLQLTQAREQIPADEPRLLEVLDEALTGVDESVRQIRSIVHALRSPDERAGLVDRLEREVSLARTGLGFAPSLILEREPKDAPLASDEVDARIEDDLADDVVAVVREGLANAARHARASSLHVRLRLSTEELQVQIQDDGVGLRATSVRSSGLANLGQRARQHGGTFTWDNSGDGGLCLSWTVPLRRAQSGP